MQLKITGVTKLELVTKLFVYSALYGLFQINYIDLIVPGARFAGYHLWLVILYFAPFLPLLFLLGFDDWELVLSLGLIASLMNDLFYYPVGMLYFGKEIDLLNWYMRQFGLKGWYDPKYKFDFLLFKITPYSWLMGLTIYLRIIITILVCWKWWTEE